MKPDKLVKDILDCVYLVVSVASELNWEVWSHKLEIVQATKCI